MLVHLLYQQFHLQNNKHYKMMLQDFHPMLMQLHFYRQWQRYLMEMHMYCQNLHRFHIHQCHWWNSLAQYRSHYLPNHLVLSLHRIIQILRRLNRHRHYQTSNFEVQEYHTHNPNPLHYFQNNHHNHQCHY